MSDNVKTSNINHNSILTYVFNIFQTQKTKYEKNVDWTIYNTLSIRWNSSNTLSINSRFFILNEYILILLKVLNFELILRNIHIFFKHFNEFYLVLKNRKIFHYLNERIRDKRIINDYILLRTLFSLNQKKLSKISLYWKDLRNFFQFKFNNKCQNKIEYYN